ncbi:hypothetical protein C8R47DRAFT_1085308, partial [Mycena vitilis]
MCLAIPALRSPKLNVDLPPDETSDATSAQSPNKLLHTTKKLCDAAHTLPLASTAWMGLRDTAIVNAAERAEDEEFFIPENRTYDYDEIMAPELRMHLIEWDGVPGPVVDIERTVFLLLAGRPRDPKWGPNVADKAAEAMETAAQQIYGDTFYAE